jgi:hypothetical protein
MTSFLIASYKIRLELQRQGDPVTTRRARVLEIASVPEYHGIVERAVLSFSTSWDAAFNAPVVGFYSTANKLQPVLTCWLPSSEFSYWYDVLRSEQPLTFFYNITPIGGANYVDQISLGSSTEPLGEGPEDFSS